MLKQFNEEKAFAYRGYYFRHDNSSRYADDDQTPCVPSLDVKLKPSEATLGSPTRFLVKMSGFPVPEIQWYLDGETVAQVRFQTQISLGIVLPEMLLLN